MTTEAHLLATSMRSLTAQNDSSHHSNESFLFDGDERASDGEDGIRARPNRVTCQWEGGDGCPSIREPPSTLGGRRVACVGFVLWDL